MNNKIVIGIVSFLAVAGFLFVAYKLTNGPQTSAVFPEVNKVLVSDHVKWATDSAAKKNILVEYGDLQCPACKSFHDFLAVEVEATGAGKTDLTKKITFVYRNYPLVQAHQHAEEAAYSAEAAGNQNKFFEMVDMLYNNQQAWASKNNAKEIFEGYAKGLKLDLDKFRKDRDSKEIKDKVSADSLSGDKAQVNSTPTFFLNGKKVEVNSFDEFKKLLVDL